MASISNEDIIAFLKSDSSGNVIKTLQGLLKNIDQAQAPVITACVEKLVKSEDVGIRFWAKKVLNETGKYHPKNSQFSQSEAIAGEKNKELPVEMLVEKLKSVPSTHVSIEVIRKICESKKPEALVALKDYLKSCQDIYQVSYLTKFIGIFYPSESTLHFLLPYLKHSDERVVANTIEGIDAMGLPSGIAIISQLLDNPSARIRANAAKAIAGQKFDKAFPVIEKMLRTKDKINFVFSACYAIQIINDQRFFSLLGELLNDEITFEISLATILRCSDKGAVISFLQNISLEDACKQALVKRKLLELTNSTADAGRGSSQTRPGQSAHQNCSEPEEFSFELLISEEVQASCVRAIAIIKRILERSSGSDFTKLAGYMQSCKDTVQISFLARHLPKTFPNETLLPNMGQLLRHENEGVVVSTIEGLAFIKTPSSVALVAQMAGHSSNSVRSTAGRVLSEFAPELTTAVLKKLLKAKDKPNFVIAACQSAKLLKDPEYLQPLVNFVGDPLFEKPALDAIIGIGGDESIKTLESLLDIDVPEFRAKILQSIKQIKSQGQSEKIEKVISDTLETGKKALGGIFNLFSKEEKPSKSQEETQEATKESFFRQKDQVSENQNAFEGNSKATHDEDKQSSTQRTRETELNRADDKAESREAEPSCADDKAEDREKNNFKKSKECPFCGEQINLNAIKCRYCNEFMEGSRNADRIAGLAEAALGNINPYRIIGLISSILMGIGIFLPFERFPIFGGPSIFQRNPEVGSIYLFFAILCIVGYAIRSYLLVILVSGFTGLAFYAMLEGVNNSKKTLFKAVFTHLKQLGIHDESASAAPPEIVHFGEGAYLIGIGISMAFIFTIFASVRENSLGIRTFHQKIVMLTFLGGSFGWVIDFNSGESLFYLLVFGLTGFVTAVFIEKLEGLFRK